MSSDALLARIERHGVLVAVVLALGALIAPRGGVRLSIGILGGALISATSYWAIKRGVTGLTDRVVAGEQKTPSGPRQALSILVGRYALLALIAYVMIARLRLSPLGLLLGASVIPIAVAIEALAAQRISARTQRDNG